jgi:hypothetical protein
VRDREDADHGKAQDQQPGKGREEGSAPLPLRPLRCRCARWVHGASRKRDVLPMHGLLALEAISHEGGRDLWMPVGRHARSILQRVCPGEV